MKIWIFSFNMPIFFVLCGYLKAKRGIGKFGTIAQFRLFIIKRIRSLLVPYFSFGVLLIIFFNALKLLSGGELIIRPMMIKLLTFQGIESMWFLSCYFFVEIIFICFVTYLSKHIRILVMIGMILMLAVLNIVGMPEQGVLRLIIKCFIGLIFTVIGFGFARYKIDNKLSLLQGSLLLLFGFVAAQINGLCGISALEFRSIILFFVLGMTSSLSLFVIFKSLFEKGSIKVRLLEKFGINSIIIVCTNNILIEVIRLFDSKMTKNILLNIGWIGDIMFFIIMIVLENFVIEMFSGRLGILFGRNYNSKRQI